MDPRAVSNVGGDCDPNPLLQEHHPRLSPLGNNLGAALRGFPQHVRVFVARRTLDGAAPSYRPGLMWPGRFMGRLTECHTPVA